MDQLIKAQLPDAGFPVERLVAFLEMGPLQVEPIPGGQSNPTYYVQSSSKRMVLRRKPSGDVLPSAHAIDREYCMLEALQGQGVPAPEVILLEEKGDVIGTPFYLMECLEGRVYADSSLPNMAPADRRQVYLDAANVLAKLHNIDWSAVGLKKFSRPEGYFERQVARWSKQWQLSKTRGDENVENIGVWLSHHIPANSHSTIVHGDFRIGNLMLHPTAPRIIGVLDWELSTIGDPMADVAHFLCFWDLTSQQLGGIADCDLSASGIPSREDFLAAYHDANGIDTPFTLFHRIFALYRMAIIMEGITARAHSGNNAHKDALKVGALSREFAASAADILAQKG